MYYEPGHYLKNIIAIIIVALIVFALVQLPKTRSYDDFSYNTQKTFKKVLVKIRPSHSVGISTSISSQP